MQNKSFIELIDNKYVVNKDLNVNKKIMNIKGDIIDQNTFIS